MLGKFFPRDARRSLLMGECSGTIPASIELTDARTDDWNHQGETVAIKSVILGNRMLLP
jgi:hypothetical protein